MATITVPDATFDRLARHAAGIGVTVEQLVLPVLDAIAPAAPTPEERTRALEEWDRRIQARADRYPPGHRVAIDRAEFYAGREDDES